MPDRPLLGAEIWIEPGQTPAQVDAWFDQLATEHMPVARIFLMWSYLEPRPGQWDFSLYDEAFRAAAKYHVRIVATLTPNGPPPFLGGDGTQGVDVFPSERRRELASAYLHKVVQHYHSSSALDTWLLVNEPGQAPTSDPYAIVQFRLWLPGQYDSIQALNAAWGSAYSTFAEVIPPSSSKSWNRNPALDWDRFWEQYQTSQLEWLATQVRRIDSTHPLHVNPAGLLSNLAEVSDDLPAWRPFLDTLGCSIHPAWHFGLLNRDQYALGVSYINDLVRGSIQPKPYWVTELQGGNNIYSGLKPMDPTANDIAQWVWTSIGAGADRVIFWLLNARRAGGEAGEWSLLDFQQRPSAQLTTASMIGNVIDQHQDFFSKARPHLPPISVILSLTTMTFEEVFHDSDDPARGRNAHILAALGFYEALSELGSPPKIAYFDDYDWRSRTATPRTAIVPDARELTISQMALLKAFVLNGNTLILTGLTGFYGPHAIAWPLAGYPLADVTGGEIREVHLQSTTPIVSLSTPANTKLPSRFWLSTIVPLSSSVKPIGEEDGQVTATERDLPNGGKVIWIPSPVGIGAWLTDPAPLARYLQATSLNSMPAEPFRFPAVQRGCILRVLEHNGAWLTVVANGSDVSLSCRLLVPAGFSPTVLWGASASVEAGDYHFALSPRATDVDLWTKEK